MVPLLQANTVSDATFGRFAITRLCDFFFVLNLKALMSVINHMHSERVERIAFVFTAEWNFSKQTSSLKDVQQPTGIAMNP
mmetsp:Transcript_27914/g.41202  ORF Transcript_27914/g.41202 Transcript_27914/m.41202 type:complete len:81 (+) Transcript_27914:151-393(+)